MKIILGLFGRKGSGKDTFADYLVENFGFQKLSFAGPLKNTCKELFSLTDAQLNDPVLKETVVEKWNLTPRQILQKVGTDLFRNHFSSTFWVDIMKNKLDALGEDDKIVITDIRFPNEYELVDSFENSFVIHIDREQSKEIIDEHISENWSFRSKHVVSNNKSKDDFYKNIHFFLKKNNVML